jgi:hypothetical protein
MKQVDSVFLVITKEKRQEVTVSGCGQETITFLRKEYPRYTKFILEGFKINGKFVPVKL